MRKITARRFTCLCLLCMMIVIGASCCLAAPVTSSRGYSLTLPQAWRTDTSGKTGNDLVVFTDDPAIRFTPNLNVRLGHAGPHDTLQSAKVFINRVYSRKFAQWKRLSQSFTDIGGQQALDTTATFLAGSPGRLMRLRQSLVIKNGTLYFFTSVSPEEAHVKYDKSFNDILRSIRWTAGG